MINFLLCLSHLLLHFRVVSIVECERRVRNLLCGLPDYQITLGRFMGEYEKKYGSKMSYYGHTKLSGVLETFKSIIVSGKYSLALYIL